MHFALPPRKTSRPPPYMAAKNSRSSSVQRVRLKQIGWIVSVLILLLLLLSWFRNGFSIPEALPADAPSAVIVTTFNPTFRGKYEQLIRDNRETYAERHGYATFFPNTTNYDLSNPSSPASWSKIPAVRHAMALYPHSSHFFYLDEHALIMNEVLSIHDHIMKPSRLKEIVQPDRPVVPPDSVIHTSSNSNPEGIDLVITQDGEGIAQGSFIIRRGDWAEFFLDAWFDPLYRSYNFQRAEGHALEHLVQWHGTVLARMALVPQRIMNSYVRGPQNETYKEGDFVAVFHDCDKVKTGSGMSCEEEATAILESQEEEEEEE